MKLELLRQNAMSHLFWTHCIAACLSDVITSCIGIALDSRSFDVIELFMIFSAPIVVPLRLFIVLTAYSHTNRFMLISCGIYVGLMVLGFAILFLMKQREKQIAIKLETDNE